MRNWLIYCVGNIGGTYLGPVVLVPQVCIVAIGKTQLLPRYIQNEKGELNLEPRRIVSCYIEGLLSLK